MLVEPRKISKPAMSREYGRRKFPDRADYEHAVQVQVGGTDGTLAASPCIAAGVARHWHTTGQTGCLFARLLARKANSAEWPTAVVSSASTDALRAIDETLESCVSDPRVQLVSLVFPEVVTIADVKHLVYVLDSHTSLVFFEDRAVHGWARVAGRFDIGDDVLAWIMAFGPFDEWPPTRRGPVLELVVRTKPKREGLFEKLNQDPSVAHLADINLGLDTARTSRMFDGTELATRDVLGVEPDGLSAAKTTFSFPAADWDNAPSPPLPARPLADEPDYPTSETS